MFNKTLKYLTIHLYVCQCIGVLCLIWLLAWHSG